MPPLPEGCSNLLRDFLTQCFHKDPAKRPDAETLCEHEWLKQNWAPHKVRVNRSGRHILSEISTTYRIYDRKIAFHFYVVSARICRSRKLYDISPRSRCRIMIGQLQITVRGRMKRHPARLLVAGSLMTLILSPLENIPL